MVESVNRYSSFERVRTSCTFRESPPVETSFSVPILSLNYDEAEEGN